MDISRRRSSKHAWRCGGKCECHGGCIDVLAEKGFLHAPGGIAFFYFLFQNDRSTSGGDRCVIKDGAYRMQQAAHGLCLYGRLSQRHEVIQVDINGC